MLAKHYIITYPINQATKHSKNFPTYPWKHTPTSWTNTFFFLYVQVPRYVGEVPLETHQLSLRRFFADLSTHGLGLAFADLADLCCRQDDAQRTGGSRNEIPWIAWQKFFGGGHGWVVGNHRWWQLKCVFLGKLSNLTSIFFKWVETTN